MWCVWKKYEYYYASVMMDIHNFRDIDMVVCRQKKWFFFWSFDMFNEILQELHKNCLLDHPDGLVPPFHLDHLSAYML